MAAKHSPGLTEEEEEFLKRSHHKPKKDGEVFIDVHGNAHKVNPNHKTDGKVATHVPGATNFLTSSDRVNHRFETTNESSYGGSRSRSNSPGRVAIHHRKSTDSPGRRGSGSGEADSPRSRNGSRSGSPAAGAKRSGSHVPSRQAEEMVAKMLEASIDRVHRK